MLFFYLTNVRNTEAYPGLPQASAMDSFASIVNGKKSTYEVVMELDFGQNIVVSICDALRDLVSFSTI